MALSLFRNMVRGLIRLSFLTVAVLACIFLTVCGREALESSKHDRRLNAATSRINATRNTDIVKAAEQIAPAVVAIMAYHTELYRSYPRRRDFFEFPFGRLYERKVPTVGSGVIIDSKGHVLTNQHVIEGAEQLSVMLADGRTVQVSLAGMDRTNDVAVLKLETDSPPSAAILGTSSDLKVGEWVLAVGNPFGILIDEWQPTVTVGVVSATKRSFKPMGKDSRVYQDMIQTDAAINPGNSGGPLVNVLGEVVGINTFIMSESGGSEGVGFAMPIDRAMSSVKEILEYGRARKVSAGFDPMTINRRIAELLELTRAGGVCAGYMQLNGPADKAGMEPGDAIRSMDGKEISDMSDYVAALAGKRVGDVVEFTVEREGKLLKFSVTLEEME